MSSIHSRTQDQVDSVSSFATRISSKWCNDLSLIIKRAKDFDEAMSEKLSVEGGK
jgi:hypothetical protein